ncbi:MAG: PEP-CTERM sorting domain-containing protein [Phycisphaerae bacterium]|nr:PEP-CTERM sorting domain-containing protein [Phycisphaerae bacterium]
MKKLSAIVMVLAFASVAFADAPIYSGAAVTFEPLDAVSGLRAGVIYSNMTGAAYSVSAEATGGVVSADDYDSISTAGATTQIEQFRFVGGADVAGGVIFFTFFDSASNLLDSFGFLTNQAGYGTYTITLNTPVTVADAGTVQMWGNNGYFPSYPITVGTWFLTPDAPTVGTTTDWPGYAGGDPPVPLNHNFEMTEVPEPATLALLGLGALALIRRR